MENNMNMKSMDAFKGLTREEMYEELKLHAPGVAKGKSRAPKATLIELYRFELEAQAQLSAMNLSEDAAVRVTEMVLSRGEVSGGENRLVVVDPSTNDLEHRVAAMSGLKADVVVLDEAKDLPKVAGVDEMARVNPELPEMPFQAMPDGTLELPHNGPMEWVHKDTNQQDRPMTAKQGGLWEKAIKAFKKFQANPADSTSRREAKAYFYSLKTAGVLVNPVFHNTLEKGAKHVRDVRRQLKAGVFKTAEET